MRQPYQCIAVAQPYTVESCEGGFLITACGPRLLSTCLTTGTIISEWPAGDITPEVAVDEAVVDEDRPRKKQKKAPTHDAAASIIRLTLSHEDNHAVVVTEDKVLRVFEILSDGRLVELSQRCMPKRPCAVQITPDDETILCGDKFGDVYALPILAEEESDEMNGLSAPPLDQSKQKTFKPPASNSTVHTQRNRRALEEQLKQVGSSSRKKLLNFKHKLLLGHVSMLTDMRVASCDINGKQRDHIITADRDEHIRVSRSLPQAHIIEGYCLGHTEYISKICPIPGTNLLASGGGDDWVGIWEWPRFELKFKLNLRLPVTPEGPQSVQPDHDISVSGIWTASLSASIPAEIALVVACEKVPALFGVPIRTLLAQSTSQESLSTPAFSVRALDYTPLDVVDFRGRIIVAVDDRSSQGQRLKCLDLGDLDGDGTGETGETFTEDSELTRKIDALNALEGPAVTDNALDDLLYGVAKLRKRRGLGEVEDEKPPEGEADD